MAKILVADDNSNIQKMVGLALKDQGIDVVAVGNGEAAVRKISDVHPDLVLADVFMPVRNGYEVCQYVKADSALSHIPVILLVGAFDPLDEQEAQRVGADGVLKKPFVPPDPLISMVKSALARAGVAVGGAVPAPTPVEEPVHAAQMLAPRAPAATNLAPVQEFPSADAEPVHEAVPTGPEPVKIESGSEPLAFGNLLETPTAQQEDDAGYATTARPELERDWHSGKDEDEEMEDEEAEHSASWRRDGGDDSIEGEGAGGGEKDWRETAFSEVPARKPSREAWTPTKEISSMEEAAETEPSVSTVVTQAPAAETKVTPAPVAPFSADAWSAALNPKGTVEAATVEAPAPPREEAAPASSSVAPPAEAEKPSSTGWYSAVSSPWEAEAEKASKLATTWDDAPTKAAEAPKVEAKSDPGATVDSLPETLSQKVQEKAKETALPTATVVALREETRQVAETATQIAPLKDTGAKPPEPSMEDLVAKVLAKMSPDMLQAVTREILKPVVESMVREELKAKK